MKFTFVIIYLQISFQIDVCPIKHERLAAFKKPEWDSLHLTQTLIFYFDNKKKRVYKYKTKVIVTLLFGMAKFC